MSLLEGVNYKISSNTPWALLFKSNPKVIDIYALINCCDNRNILPPITDALAEFDITAINDYEINVILKNNKIISQLSFTIEIEDDGVPTISNVIQQPANDKISASFIQWYNAVPKNWELTLKTQSELFTTRAEADQLTRDEFITRLKEIGVTCNPAYFGQW